MRRYPFLVLLFAILLGGCDPLTTQPDPSGWNTDISGVGDYRELRGTAAAASQFGATQVAIEVQATDGVGENQTFSWRLVQGSCSAPGGGIGPMDRYPALTLSEQGRASAQANINQMLRPTGSYALVVRTAAGDLAACGDLERQTFSGTDPAARNIVASRSENAAESSRPGA